VRDSFKEAAVAKTKRTKPSPRAVASPNLVEAAKSPDYQAAVVELSKLCGDPWRPMKGTAGGFTFRIHSGKKRSFRLGKVHSDFLWRGCYVFRTDAVEKDHIGVLPTTDKYSVILAVGTSGMNWNVTTKDVVARLRKLEKEQPFVLDTVTKDFVGGEFTTKVKRPKELALRALEFCPDLENPVEYEKDLRKGKLWLWWT
jgi:hypothetical protein